jgi:hypothetical protein
MVHKESKRTVSSKGNDSKDNRNTSPSLNIKITLVWLFTGICFLVFAGLAYIYLPSYQNLAMGFIVAGIFIILRQIFKLFIFSLEKIEAILKKKGINLGTIILILFFVFLVIGAIIFIISIYK